VAQRGASWGATVIRQIRWRALGNPMGMAKEEKVGRNFFIW